jgi:DNA-binding XRE family transcriptional regulator
MTDPFIIKNKLKRLGITQSQIARELGCTRQCVNIALAGVETVTPVRVFVAQLLGEPVESLFPPARKRGRKSKAITANRKRQK